MEYKRLLLVCVLAIMTTVCAMAETIIIDNKSDDFATAGSWSTGSSSGYHVTNYRHTTTVTGSATASASWFPTFESAGTYEVAIWYVQGGNRPTDAPFTINHSGGPSTVYVDQTTNGSHIRQCIFP